MMSLQTFVSLLLAVCALQSGPQMTRAATNSAVPVYPPATPPPKADPPSAPPPSAPAKRSQKDLEKLVAPIALYPDNLIATILPASAYPVEIVLAARFVAGNNNAAAVDSQAWDDSVKAVAKIPAILENMSTNLEWTVELGKAFVEQEKEVMDTIQALRFKAKEAGTLKSTPQQVVAVTNAVVERVYEEQVVYVTNNVVQIQSSNPQVVYVPTYNPTVVYAPPPYDPLAPLVTFGAAIAVGAIIANNCDWHYGGVYVGGGGMVVWGGGQHPPYYPPPPGFHPPPYHPPPGYRPPPSGTRPPGYPPPGAKSPPPAGKSSTGSRGASASTQPAKRWQPDQSRLSTTGAPRASTSEARGWATGGANAATRPTSGISAGTTWPGTAAGQKPASSRPSGAVSANQRPTAPASASTRPSPSVTKSSPSPGASAFSGVSSGATSQSYSSRGATSRSGGFGGGGARGGGGRGR